MECGEGSRHTRIRPLFSFSPPPIHPSDVPTKEFLLSLNAARTPTTKFVVADLDDTHLFVDPAALPALEAAVRARGDDLTYTAPADPTG